MCPRQVAQRVLHGQLTLRDKCHRSSPIGTRGIGSTRPSQHRSDHVSTIALTHNDKDDTQDGRQDESRHKGHDERNEQDDGRCDPLELEGGLKLVLETAAQNFGFSGLAPRGLGASVGRRTR